MIYFAEFLNKLNIIEKKKSELSISFSIYPFCLLFVKNYLILIALRLEPIWSTKMDTLLFQAKTWGVKFLITLYLLLLNSTG